MKNIFSEEKYEKITQTKSFQLVFDMFQKKIDSGEEIVEIFKNNIVLINDIVFSKRKNSYLALLYKYMKEGLITPEQNEDIQKLIKLKKDRKFDNPEVNLKKYFTDFAKYYKFMTIKKENTIAFLALPLLYISDLASIIDLKYKDVELQHVSDIVVISFTNSKGTEQKIIITDKTISTLYFQLFNKLVEQYGEDDYIFARTKQKTWNMAKTGITMFQSFEQYIKNTSDDSQVKETSFVTFIRRELSSKAKDYFTAIWDYLFKNIYEQVAHAYARKFNWHIEVNGDTALNLLGLSTQIPGQYIYHSDGPNKIYELNNSATIEFKKSALKNIGFKHKESSLIVQVLKTLGKDNIDDMVVKKIREQLDVTSFEKILKDTQSSTGWVYETIKEICKNG